MSVIALRRIRQVALALIFLLAGVYAALLFRTTDSPSALPATVVATLPDFSLPDLDGQPRAIREWADRTLVINFWATWCAPCRREMPLLQQLQDEHPPDELTVVGIAVDRLPDVAAYIPEAGISYPILVGQQDAMDAAELFGPPFLGLPFTVFVAPGGAVLSVHAGEIAPRELGRIMDLVGDVAAGRLSAAAGRRALNRL